MEEFVENEKLSFVKIINIPTTEVTSQNEIKENSISDHTLRRSLKNKRTTRGRIKNRLPENFHQRIIELENEFLNLQNYEIVEQLVHLYKVGVEYYSDRSLELQQDYMERMHMFLSSKNVLKLIKNKIDPPSEHNEERPKNSSHPFRDIKRRQSKMMKLELNKLNYRNSIKSDNKNLGDHIRKFEINIVKAGIKLENGIKLQREEFLEKMKMKKFKKFLKSDSKINRRNQSFIKRKSSAYYNKSAHLPKDRERNKFFNSFSFRKQLHFSNEEEENKIKKSDELSVTQFKETDSLDTSKIISKKINKQKKKHVGNIIENYLSKITSTFMNKFCEPNLIRTTEYLKENYQKKKDNFTEYYDSRAEIEIMLLDNPNHRSKTLYKQLIESMRIDYDKFIIDLNKSQNTHINNIVTQGTRNIVSMDQEISQQCDELIVQLINVFK